MTLTWRVPTSELHSVAGARPTRRPQLLRRVAAALVLTLAAGTGSLMVAAPASASRMPSPGANAYGNDVSWPQCPSSQGGYNLPGPMSGSTFAIMGLTDGGSFRANPCLGRQVAVVRSRHLWAGAYAISTYPTRAQLARYGGTGSVLRRLHRVGAAQARFNIATMGRVGLRSPMVWVDVEPRARAPWARASYNNMVLDGVIAGYRAAHLRVGIYSYLSGWNTITGGRVMKGMPTWVPVGNRGAGVAQVACARASFSGTRPWVTQWTDGVRDYNRTCPGVTGRAAHGNLLTRYLKVRLAIGSHGTAVVLMQRSLRVLADGDFGPLTRARVVAFQRAHHLVANGVVGTAVWRALGAGTRTYTPAVRGFMGSLFAST